MLKLLALLPLLIAALLPDYGACRVYDWSPSLVWFVWEGAPTQNVERYELTFYVKDLRSGAEYLTGAADYLVISWDSYVPFSLDAGDYQIRNLTCIARRYDLSYETTTNAGPWTRWANKLPVVRR